MQPVSPAGLVQSGCLPKAVRGEWSRLHPFSPVLRFSRAAAGLVVLLALGGAYAVYRHLNGNIHQVNISGELGTQPRGSGLLSGSQR